MISAWQMEAVQQKQHHDSFGANRAGVYLHGGTVVPASGLDVIRGEEVQPVTLLSAGQTLNFGKGLDVFTLRKDVKPGRLQKRAPERRF